jgi:hypothetical protein
VFINKDIGPFLVTPQFRLPKRVLITEKSVKIVEQADRTKVMKVSFPYDEALINSIKEYKKKQTYNPYTGTSNFMSPPVNWCVDTRTWDFHLTEENILWVHSVLANRGFTFDKDIDQFVEQIHEITKNMEKYVPMVIFDEKFSYKNIHKNVPAPTSDQLLDVLMDARKYGIHTWDESIELAIEHSDLHPISKDFLRSSDRNFAVDTKKYKFADLTEIISHMGTVLFVIPGGTELESLKVSHEFLKNAGISNDEITVLFRLDSNAGKMCNEYVKAQGLNNSITDKIKFIFVSIKVPKPLVATKRQIDAIINLGSNSAHYTVKNLLKQHHCVINPNISYKK